MLLHPPKSVRFAPESLCGLLRIVQDAEKSDILDVLEYISYNIKPITHEMRVARVQSRIFARLDNRQKEFLEFVLAKNIQTGVDQPSEEKLPDLLKLEYQALAEAQKFLGSVEFIRQIFFDFQRRLYLRTST